MQISLWNLCVTTQDLQGNKHEEGSKSPLFIIKRMVNKIGILTSIDPLVRAGSRGQFYGISQNLLN
jgi:hypothetical protein